MFCGTQNGLFDIQKNRLSPPNWPSTAEVVVIENICESWDWVEYIGLLFPKCWSLVLRKCQFRSGGALRGWSLLTKLKLSECSSLSVLWLPPLVTLRVDRTVLYGNWAPRALVVRNVYLDHCTPATQATVTQVGAVKVSLVHPLRVKLRSSWPRTVRVLRLVSVGTELVFGKCVCPVLVSLQISFCSVGMAGLELFLKRSPRLSRLKLESLLTPTIFTDGFGLGGQQQQPVSYNVSKLRVLGMRLRRGTRALLRSFPNLRVLDLAGCWLLNAPPAQLIPCGHSLRQFRGSEDLGFRFLPNTLVTLVVPDRLSELCVPVRLLRHDHLTRLCLLGGLGGGSAAELTLTRALAQNNNLTALLVQGVNHDRAWLDLLRARQFEEFELPGNKLSRVALLELLRLAIVKKKVSRTLNLGTSSRLKVTSSARVLGYLRRNSSVQTLFLRNWCFWTRFGNVGLRRWIKHQVVVRSLVFGVSRQVNHQLMSGNLRTVLGRYLSPELVSVIVKLAAF
jgi:hypothetical protein